MFRVAKLRPDAQVPRQQQQQQQQPRGDAGYDVAAVEDVTLPPRSGPVRVSTGIAIQIPMDCYARVAPRSGLAAKYGIDVLAGVVDASYRGEIQVVLINHGDAEFVVKAGDRIAQLIFERIYTPHQLLEVTPQELSQTGRGAGGFGSSGMGISGGGNGGGMNGGMGDIETPDLYHYMLGA